MKYTSKMFSDQMKTVCVATANEFAFPRVLLNTAPAGLCQAAVPCPGDGIIHSGILEPS